MYAIEKKNIGKGEDWGVGAILNVRKGSLEPDVDKDLKQIRHSELGEEIPD